MNIYQVSPSLAYGDAIGNNVLALNEALKEAGYQTQIYAENIDPRLSNGNVKPIKDYKDSLENIVIYHLSIGCELNEKIRGYKARIIVVYHNVTPPDFWQPYNKEFAKLCEYGLKTAKNLSEKPEMCFADSDYNKQDLIKMGYSCPIKTLPILIAFDDYKKKPSQKIIDQYKDDGYVNLVFTGRVAPNKKQEDIIAAFYYYKNYINPKSRLIIAGSFDKKDIYYNKLKKYVEELELEDVCFTGHIPFDEILAYYQIADLLVCMSEHEGFCVPLVEAMYFHVPIIAYDCAAVGETLGGSGILLKNKDPRLVAEAINRVIEDDQLKKKIIASEEERLKYFDNSRIKKEFINYIKELISEG